MPLSLFYNAFAFIIVLCLVIEHTFFAGVGVTINTEVTAGVVLSDVLAYHATALTYNFNPNSKSFKYAGGIVARIREMFWYLPCTKP